MYMTQTISEAFPGLFSFNDLYKMAKKDYRLLRVWFRDARIAKTKKRKERVNFPHSIIALDGSQFSIKRHLASLDSYIKNIENESDYMKKMALIEKNEKMFLERKQKEIQDKGLKMEK